MAPDVAFRRMPFMLVNQRAAHRLRYEPECIVDMRYGATVAEVTGIMAETFRRDYVEAGAASGRRYGNARREFLHDVEAGVSVISADTGDEIARRIALEAVDEVERAET